MNRPFSTLFVKAAVVTATAAMATAGLALAAPASPVAGPGETAAVPTAGSASNAVVIYFLRGEHFARVTRRISDGALLDEAVRALLAGPTRSERRRGIRSRIPTATELNRTSVADGVVTIDLSADLARGSAQSVQARLAQLVYVATRLPGVDGVRIAVDGVLQHELGGMAIGAPLTRASFAPVPQGGPAPTPPPRSPSALVLAIQQRLIVLRYLPSGADDGIAGPQTRHGILAFQGWEGLPRDGRATAALKALLDRASRPIAPAGPARRLDVSLSRQVALLVHRGRVLRAIHVSTGKPSSPTPPGRFRIFRKEVMSWSVPFRVWLPYASYFNRGIAFHESADVPTFPASAGCVRVPSSDSSRVYSFAAIGTPVIVRR